LLLGVPLETPELVAILKDSASINREKIPKISK
jgi:hypothetical protein